MAAEAWGAVALVAAGMRGAVALVAAGVQGAADRQATALQTVAVRASRIARGPLVTIEMTIHHPVIPQKTTTAQQTMQPILV